MVFLALGIVGLLAAGYPGVWAAAIVGGAILIVIAIVRSAQYSECPQCRRLVTRNTKICSHCGSKLLEPGSSSKRPSRIINYLILPRIEGLGLVGAIASVVLLSWIFGSPGPSVKDDQNPSVASSPNTNNAKDKTVQIDQSPASSVAGEDKGKDKKTNIGKINKIKSQLGGEKEDIPGETHKQATNPTKSTKAEESRTALSKSELVSLQSQLKSMGYYQGRIDGIYGPKTRAAIKQYQRKSKLPVTGKPSDQLLSHVKRH